MSYEPSEHALLRNQVARFVAADADARTNRVFAEALSQSTFGGFVVTVPVHTYQQSPGGMGYIRAMVSERPRRDARILAIGGEAAEVTLEEAAKRL